MIYDRRIEKGFSTHNHTVWNSEKNALLGQNLAIFLRIFTINCHSKHFACLRICLFSRVYYVRRRKEIFSEQETDVNVFAPIIRLKSEKVQFKDILEVAYNVCLNTF